MNEFPYMI